MQGINRIDSWEQFQSLVKVARTRTNSLAHPVTGTPGAAPVTRRMNSQAVAAFQRPVSGSPSSAPETKPPARTLGSYFDAYA